MTARREPPPLLPLVPGLGQGQIILGPDGEELFRGTHAEVEQWLTEQELAGIADALEAVPDAPVCDPEALKRDG